MSELAKKLIAENKQTKAKFLDLGHCGLTELPAELADLVWLEGLSLTSSWTEQVGDEWVQRRTSNLGESNHQLTTIEPLAALKALHALYLGKSGVEDLSPLSGLSALQYVVAKATRVKDISPLANLSALKVLDLAFTLVADISPVAKLNQLQIISLTYTKVTDLAPLARLVCLKTIYASKTQISDLSPLAGLFELNALYIDHTPIADLSPLANLQQLRLLDISRTAVTDLMPLQKMIAAGFPVDSRFDDLFGINGTVDESGQAAGIFIDDCPLSKPPIEIVEQGNAAILNYFREAEAGALDYLYEAKMLILGEGGAGKTSLLRRLYQPDHGLPSEEETTKGIDIHRHEFPLPNGRNFRLNVWDFGGQEIYHATHQFFLTRRSLYLLVDDTRRSDKLVSDSGFKDWLDLITLFGGDSPVLLFQNEKGGRSKEIDFDGIQHHYGNVTALYRGNLEHAASVDDLRQGIATCASQLEHIGEQLPASWIKIREALESRAKQVPYIGQQDYFDIYTRFLPFDRTKALHLSRYLHDLGVFLHFQDDALLSRTVILQNPWATQAVYRILDDEKIKQQAGRFNSIDCARLWNDISYADMQPELLALMERFELCYILPDSQPRTWLVPQMLPASKPGGLRNWGKVGDQALHYRYVMMPKGIISRLIVRLHRFLPSPEQASLASALFEREDSAVLAELLASGNEIVLRARGNAASVLLSVVAAELDVINQGFSGLDKRVGKWIPCQCNECSMELAPHLFEETQLRWRKEKGRIDVECPRSLADVKIDDLLSGIRFAALPAWAKEEKPRAPRIIKLFLASSNELLSERDAFELYLRQQNDYYQQEGIYFEIVRWENSFSAMSATRLQDEYHKALRDCDVFVSLFSTKVGKYTAEEFDAAFQHFKATGRPYVFTYFKETSVSTSNARREDLQSLWAFQDKLKAQGHYSTVYSSIEDLKLQFVMQLKRLLAQI